MDNMNDMIKWIVDLLGSYGVDVAIVLAVALITSGVKRQDKRRTKKLERWYFFLPFELAAVGVVLKGLATLDWTHRPTFAWVFTTFFSWLYTTFLYRALATGAYKLITGFKKVRITTEPSKP